jgi:hypothetical protein
MMNINIAVVRNVCIRPSEKALNVMERQITAMTMAAKAATPAASVGLNQPA